MFATPAKKKAVRELCHGYESWNSSAPLLPKRILCHFGLKFFPWNEAAKVKPHLSDIIISSHVRSRTFYMCWSWFRTGWMWQAGAGKWGGGLQGPPLQAGPQRMPDFFSHILQSQWKHWKTTRSHQLSSVTRRPQEKSMSKYQRRGRGVGGAAVERSLKIFQTCRCGSSYYYQPPVLHLG